MSERRDAAIRRGAGQLAAAGIEGSIRDAALLLRWVAGIDAATLAAYGDAPLTTAEAARFDDALARRAGREPLSHITGNRTFWGRDFRVTPDVLDPRPETEVMIAAALDLPPPGRVLDLGVGSGCILGTILAERASATGIGVDASPDALTIAAENLTALGVKARADLRKGDWLEGVEGQFDLILCNPPYITAEEMATLSPEVALHEPHQALSPGGDGLLPYRRIAPDLGKVMAPDARAMFEIGPAQAADVTAIFAASGFSPPVIVPDFDGRDRCLIFTVQ